MPDSALRLMAGALLGLGWGITVVWTGGLPSAALQFALPQVLALLGGLAVCVTFMIMVSRWARKAVLQAVAEADGAGKTPAP